MKRTTDDDMADSVFICFLGDCASWAIDEPTSFIVRDDRGRCWYCVGPVDGFSAGLIAAKAKDEILVMQRSAAKQGLARHGMTLALVLHVDTAYALPGFLSNESPEFLHER